MSNNITFNKNTNITFNNPFYFFAQLIFLMLRKRLLPILEIAMLSSRESAKSYHTETLCSIMLIQTNVNTAIYWVRARAADTEKTLMTILSLINDMYGTKGVSSNKKDGTIRIGKNVMYFVTLNEMKEKVHKSGGKVGTQIERNADYLICVFEEASQLDEDLVTNFRQSLRGNKWAQRLIFYNSNPWNKSQWFVDKFIKNLPEDKDAEEELITRGYNFKFNSLTKTLYYRPRYTVNKHTNSNNIKDIERLKEINYSKWKIVSLGFSGNIRGSLYAASLPKLQTTIAPYYGQNYFGGVDWGDGKTKEGSPSVCYFGGISLGRGIDIYAEMEWWNNKGKVLSTQEHIEMICNFYIEQYSKVKKPITVFIDNAALADFFITFQSILELKGFNSNQIEFLPSLKLKNTWERVESVNAYITLGILRYNKEVCKGLYKAMENCYEVIKNEPKEIQKRDRSHEWTHWLHALEYLLNTYLREFQSQLPQYVIDGKTLDKFGVY